jgi:hypothetical protein
LAAAAALLGDVLALGRGGLLTGDRFLKQERDSDQNSAEEIAKTRNILENYTDLDI